MKNKIIATILAAVFLLSAISTVSAVTIKSEGKTMDEGTITVYVFGESDDPGPGLEGIKDIKVEVKNPDESYNETLKTDDKGMCFFEGLPLNEAYIIKAYGGSGYEDADGKVLLTDDNPNDEYKFLLKSKARSNVKENLNIIGFLISHIKNMIRNRFNFCTNLMLR